MNTDVKPMICTNNDTLYVCEGKTITDYDSSLSQLCKYELSTEAAKFAVSDNEIFYIDTDGNFHVLDIAASTENKEVKTETVNDNIIIHHYSDFLVCEDKNNSSIAAFWGDNIVSSVKEYSKRFVYLSDNCLIHTSTTNTSTINLYKTYLSDPANDSTIGLPSGYGIVSIFSVNNDLVFIGSEYSSDPHLDFDKSHNLKYHQCDCIVTVDINDHKITNTRFTKEHKIVIYADNAKAVTYYNGEYLTYSLDDWKVTDKCPADKIINGGSYTFETCGYYIFVFDKSNELVERISVGV